jgi:preprotein translocase subunit SecA
MAIPFVSYLGRKVFGTRNERMVKRYLRVVEQVSAQEEAVRTLTDADLRAKTAEFRSRISGGDGENPTDLIPEVFAIAREAMDRSVGIRNIFNPNEHFDPSQLPTAAKHLYDQVKQDIENTPAREPAGDLLGANGPVQSWQFVDIPPELYNAIRELYPQSKPPFRARPFDVQIIGAMVLYEGRIAEMKTGEGKTIVAPLSCYLSGLEGKQVHVVTVNDYLVQRDRDWTFPFFRALGLTVGAIHPYHMQPPQEKQKAYMCNVVYGTTSEFGFDYLRDNMKLSTMEQVQKNRHVAIVDEVDSILIDEARTPLIISGPAHEHSPRYALADKLARHLLEKQKDWNLADQKVQSCKVEISGLEGDIRNAREKDKVPAMKERMDAARRRLPELEAERDRFTQYYEVEMDKKKATLTHDGITEAQKAAGMGSFYVGDNIDLPHLLEQAIRAHTVYQRDRDYVVAPDEDGQQGVVIVDQNTGRKMVGRQWSDGLHQAVEAKEAVPIKQETQTMATITIQNFFKLYKKLAGMTGTADTEATEFYEIYKLDVVSIPTNVPVVRFDRNDLVFIAVRDKWESIVDEIKAFHDVGRPVLVGTTSVEKSEMLSEMLTRKHNVKHEVLNAKQHEREADIIAHAGELGAVMIATNMAGRGTDIKLGNFTPQQLIEHWQRRGICPREVTPDMPEDKIVAAVYRHIAGKELGLSKGDVQSMSDDDIRLNLLRHWANHHCWNLRKDPQNMNEAELIEALDSNGSFLLHRLRLFINIEDMGGLHVIGTERHESRRIDNQLRGRCGRQGDKGSSRFFLSLEDDLMKMFAGPTTLKLLSRLGMKEGDAIEHPMLTKSVGRAQRKVEERNFLIRKNILEYDEVMDHQRHSFYGMRQDVLEGRQVKELIFEHIDDSVQDAVATYLDRNYQPNCISEWVREKLSVTIDPERIRGKDRSDLHRLVMIDAKEEAANMIRVTIGEYMPGDIEFGKGKIVEADETDWDLKGLVDWANATFKAGVTVSQVESMSREDVTHLLIDAAAKLVDETDLDPLDQYLVEHYGANELAKWASNKFGGEFKADEFAQFENPADAAEMLMAKAREAYAKREVAYPIDFAIDMTTAALQHNPQQAITQFCAWVKARYEVDWNPTALPSANPVELKKILLEEAQKWDESRISERAERMLAAAGAGVAVRTETGVDGELARTADPAVAQVEEWLQKNVGMRFTEDERERAVDDPKTVLEEKIAAMLRTELTQFERWVLLQILDQAWKDHLYAMDQLKESIGLRSFSQKDPRIEYKREGARLFDEMHQSIRDKVTDLIFKARLTPQIAAPRPQAPSQPRPAEALGPGGPGTPSPALPRGAGSGGAPRPIQPAQPAIAAAAAAATAAGTATQRRDLEVAERAGAPGSGGGKAEERHVRKKKPIRAVATVGRNEPCPCGSGKKFKQCCGKRA